MTGSLPHKFRDLEQWSSWANATEGARYQKRIDTPIEALREFHAALVPHIEDVIVYLSDFPWGTPLNEEDERLYHLGLAYMEAAVPVELGWTSSTAQDSFPVSRLTLPGRT
jgi:hypothetical protein